MTLPGVPDEAVAAAMALAWVGGDDRETVVRLFAAAWPHLYAAALRHAADEIDRPGTGTAAPDLRRMADDATAPASRRRLGWLPDPAAAPWLPVDEATP